jgi:hypothetical protein
VSERATAAAIATTATRSFIIRSYNATISGWMQPMAEAWHLKAN